MERNLASSGTSEACVSKLRRFTELDSIRGIAAVTVVLSHFQELWLPKDIALTPAPWKRAMNLALHPVDGGHEAVILFFLLSGFVLALPYAVGRQSGYVAFLVRRILRIYGPYLVALCLAVGCVYVWHGDLHHGAWAARIWSQPPNLHLIVQHLLFLGAYNSSYNPVFWSLVYEMRISLLFPLLVALVLRIGNWTVVLVALCLSGVSMFVISQYPQSLWGYSLMMTLHYIGFFMLGILLSVYHQELGTYYRSLSVGLKLALVLTSFLIYRESKAVIESTMGRWLSANSIYTIVDWFVVAGAAAAIVLALHSKSLRRFLNLAAPRYLGRISYSLYLVHFPVLFAMAFVFGFRVPMLVQFFLYLAAALTLASFFYYAVEAPFIRLSQYVGKTLSVPTAVAQQPTAQLDTA